MSYLETIFITLRHNRYFHFKSDSGLPLGPLSVRGLGLLIRLYQPSSSRKLKPTLELHFSHFPADLLCLQGTGAAPVLAAEASFRISSSSESALTSPGTRPASRWVVTISGTGNRMSRCISVLGVWDAPGWDTHMLCQRRENFLQEGLCQVSD